MGTTEQLEKSRIVLNAFSDGSDNTMNLINYITYTPTVQRALLGSLCFAPCLMVFIMSLRDITQGYT